MCVVLPFCILGISLETFYISSVMLVFGFLCVYFWIGLANFTIVFRNFCLLNLKILNSIFLTIYNYVCIKTLLVLRIHSYVKLSYAEDFFRILERDYVTSIIRIEAIVKNIHQYTED